MIILASNKDELRLHDTLQEELSEIRDWQLQLIHVAKTEFIVLGSKPKLHKKRMTCISLGGRLFHAKPPGTYLGCSSDHRRREHGVKDQEQEAPPKQFPS